MPGRLGREIDEGVVVEDDTETGGVVTQSVMSGPMGVEMVGEMGGGIGGAGSRLRLQLMVVAAAALVTGGLLVAAWMSPGRAELDAGAKVFPMERVGVNLAARGALVAKAYSVEEGVLKLKLEEAFDQAEALKEGGYLVVVGAKLYEGVQAGRRMESSGQSEAFPQFVGGSKVRVYRKEGGECRLVLPEVEVESVSVEK
jgi:hypothetical protein